MRPQRFFIFKAAYNFGRKKMTPEENERICHYAMNSIFGFEPRMALALIDKLGSAAEVFTLAEKDMDALLGPYSKYRGKICTEALDKAFEEYEKLKKRGIAFIGRHERDFPEALLECEDCPVGLFVRSSDKPSDIFGTGPFISIIGTRDLSSYGREWCTRIVEALSFCAVRPVIVSGLAIGVDITAHLTALETGLPTIAVIPTGMDRIYPERHCGYAERIAGTAGCALVTDFPPDTAPQACTFLRRNRIIAGLSQATLLIESKVKGGGMMTSRLAFSYGREIYALPGRVDDLRSRGCNLLIQSKIAEIIYDTDTLIDSLGFNRGLSRRKVAVDTSAALLMKKYSGSLTDKSMRNMLDILDFIKRNREMTVEEIAFEMGLEYRETAYLISLMENESVINVDLLRRCSINFKTRVKR